MSLPEPNSSDGWWWQEMTVFAEATSAEATACVCSLGFCRFRRGA